jgi:hypothetical protein
MAEFEIQWPDLIDSSPRLQKYFRRDALFGPGRWTMDTPAEYRNHARECIELAEKATAEHHRTLLLGMADKWLYLASLAQREAELLAAENVKKAS